MVAEEILYESIISNYKYSFQNIKWTRYDTFFYGVRIFMRVSLFKTLDMNSAFSLNMNVAFSLIMDAAFSLNMNVAFSLNMNVTFSFKYECSIFIKHKFGIVNFDSNGKQFEILGKNPFQHFNSFWFLIK